GNLEEEANEMIKYGADRMITVTHENLKEYTSDVYGQAILEILEVDDHYDFIFGLTSIGKDVSQQISSRLGFVLVSDAIEIDADGDQVVFTRPIYSGKAFEKKVIKDGMIFATIRPNNIAKLEKDESRSGDVTAKEVDVKSLRTVINEIIRKQTEGVDMSEASVVVAGGRGVKSKEGFDPLYELADVLGGAVGA